MSNLSFDTLFSTMPTPGWLALGACITVALYRLSHPKRTLGGLPGPPIPSWTFGHFKTLFGFDAIPYFEYLASNYGSTVKVYGALGSELIWTFDPAAMHSMLVKDRANFERFEDTTTFIRLTLGGGLLALKGEEHRVHRKILNPVFTMRFLRERKWKATYVEMPIFMNVAKRTCEAIDNEVDSTEAAPKDIDIFPWMTAGALELVGEAGLGYSFDSLTGKRNEYSTAIRDLLRFFRKIVPFAMILPYISNVGTPSFRRWVVQWLPIPGLAGLLHATSIQNKQAEEVLQARRTLLASGHDLTSEAGRGRDILTLLMKANEAEGVENHIDREAVVGHMNTFIFAGHETTSTAMSRIIQILAENDHIQNTLREEIRRYFAVHSDDTHHDELLELPYLDAVVRETLRLYGPVSGLFRQSQVDTVLPLEFPVNTPKGKITSIPIKKGQRILINIIMANRCERIWGERASEFWPERWIGHKLEEVTQPGAHLPGVYSSMMAFGGGPTSCIAANYMLALVEVMISILVKTFKFEPSEQQIRWETLGIQAPYLQSEMKNRSKLPKLPVRVTKID
ncbi:cytochrome P450 family protein [Ceratobasidium sp. AG-Ba]|nr:cytochrome P450 family protein [Ceratobasidium sp. AG-Ba]